MSAISAVDVRLPCGTPSARINHAAHGQLCPVCDPDDRPLAAVIPLRTDPDRLEAAIARHPSGKGLT